MLFWNNFIILSDVELHLTHVHAFVRTHTHTHARLHARTHARTHAHTHTQTHAQVHTDMITHVSLLLGIQIWTQEFNQGFCTIE